MNYVLEFNDKEDIVLYWDEPTISLDYEDHELINILKLIGRLTVYLTWFFRHPEYEIKDCIEDFKNKFDNPAVHTISSNDYKKTIPILGKDNKVKLPHNICSSYEELQKSIDHCCNNLTILRYFDIKSIVEFAKHLKSKNYIKERFLIENYFETIDDVNVSNIKLWYLEILKTLTAEEFDDIKS